MACADPPFICNFVIAIRSPLGEMRLHGPIAARSRERRRLLCVLRAAVERFMREQLRNMARDIDPQRIDRFAACDPEAARDLRKLFRS